MRQKSGLFLLSCLILITASCTSIKIESNKDPDYTSPITKVYVIIDAGGIKINQPLPAKANEAPKSEEVLLAEYLQKKIKASLTQIGIETEATGLTGLELSEAKLEDSIKAFGPQATMTITLAGNTVNTSYYSFNPHEPLKITIKKLDAGSEAEGSTRPNALIYTPPPTPIYIPPHIATAHTTITNNFDISIYDVSQKKRVWRANLSINQLRNASDADAIVDKILTAMTQDGLVQIKNN